MLKKIHVRDIRSGMFINEICGSWMEHPFWKKSFLLSAPEDLKTLQTCGIQEVWIDTEKGLDVEGKVISPSKEEEERKVEAELKKVATANRVVQRVPVQNEVQRARAILSKGKAAVTSMFNEARMGNAISVSDAEPLVDEISSSIERNPEAFLNLARLKNVDDYTYLHSVAVCGLMIALGKQLGLSGRDLKDAGIAGLMHDVGKALIPNEVLNKPGKLTDEEFEIIKTHPRKGWEILNIAEGANEVALDVCLHHHERVDGTGYPDRISGEPLTLFARMGAVCDVYDALTSNRCYKNGWEPAETIRKMAEWRNGHFDERVFQAFVKTIGIYPSGTLVRLKSGRLAIVIEQTEKSLLTPIVKAFFSTKSNEPIMPEMIDLSRSRESIAGAEDPAQWGFDLKQIAGF
ncbi:cyclic di-GMP phosphodiesterase [Sideroxyarcus emersonii]|uniref:Cyclic di-GMP phosphodiesterase n=1 Tax=Sideroxyarcus emersonii TaxID=2764705 RepID=A0AAN1X9Z5_9PROT|nr:HD-GYP domain-containing protein [Sideroxyarcus emersonii]BCK87329.1 cyclic di-GMP phosphodiesterase [Sideroxyarcus emersonii]